VKTLAWPAALAALFTGLNALKPLQIDDAAYECYARQIARQPLEPYGFVMFWYDHPQPANEVLAPPLLPYYWALLRRLMGDNPLLWKLGLYPWALLLALGLRGLLRRFAAPLADPLLALLLLSPLLLPAFNLMLDIPALALSLSALVLFFRAMDDRRPALAVWAGLLAGLGMQTKYTAFLAAPVILLYSGLAGRLLLGLAACLTAAHVFVLWECLLTLIQGRSHFLANLPGETSWLQKLDQLPFLFSLLGGVGPAGVLLGLAGLGLRRRWLALAGGVVLLGYLLIALLDVRFTSSARLSPKLFGAMPEANEQFELAEVLFDLWAAAGGVVVGLAAWRLLRRELERDSWWRSKTLFLLIWLAVEVAGYVVLTPFPAVRRVLGVGVVLALLLGRLASTRAALLWRQGTLTALLILGIGLGLGFWALDTHGAWVQKRAAEMAAAWIQERGGGRVWYVGHWGFQFYAERLGMTAVVPRYPQAEELPGLPPPSRLRRGDWLVVPDIRQNQQEIALAGEPLELEACLVLDGWLTLNTVPAFHGGRTPVEHREGSYLEVRIFRVREDFTPRLGEPVSFHAGE